MKAAAWRLIYRLLATERTRQALARGALWGLRRPFLVSMASFAQLPNLIQILKSTYALPETKWSFDDPHRDDTLEPAMALCRSNAKDSWRMGDADCDTPPLTGRARTRLGSLAVSHPQISVGRWASEVLRYPEEAILRPQRHGGFRSRSIWR